MAAAVPSDVPALCHNSHSASGIALEGLPSSCIHQAFLLVSSLPMMDISRDILQVGGRLRAYLCLHAAYQWGEAEML